MKKTLVVVESPAKAKTIEKFLGKNYSVKASMGHLRDLPKSQFGVDVEHDFEPKYINIRGKGDLIKSLKEAAKKADLVYLATDPDREGEAIAWHLSHILSLDPSKPCRIVFHEITKPAIQAAVKQPRPIDFFRVDAQQARRLLDRIVGYQLSPLLWRKVRKGLSAGRVQSVAVDLICQREDEIEQFVEQEYWSITANLREKERAPLFEANLWGRGNEKIEITSVDQADALCAELKQQSYQVTEVKQRERRRNPAPPFTTSSLQQEASRRLGFTARKTMMVAQQLYEGISLGSAGQVGLITYMRTDSVRIAESAQEEARHYIEQTYGSRYLPSKPPHYQSKKNSQDAHEAIRPTGTDMSLAEISAHLNKDQAKLYGLIWARFLASQMLPALYDTMAVELAAGQYNLRANGSKLKFDGFLAVYKDTKEEEQAQVSLPLLKAGQQVLLDELLPEQHFTQPPARYTEASLVKTLEERGIGRPSTYAPIIDTIVTRGYVEKIEKRFHPTELGVLITDLLKEYFAEIVDVEFTAMLEGKLDDVAEGDRQYKQVLHEFYQPFSKQLTHADQEIGQIELPEEVTDIPCELCGRMMVVKRGRYGNFLACPGFPECRNTKPIVKDMGVPCPKCGGKIVERHTRKGKVFYGCQNYPDCDFVTWNQPLPETCTVCGSFMVRKGFRKNTGPVICGNPDCPTNADQKEKDAVKEAAIKDKSTSKVKNTAKTKSTAKIKSTAKSEKPVKSKSTVATKRAVKAKGTGIAKTTAGKAATKPVVKAKRQGTSRRKASV